MAIAAGTEWDVRTTSSGDTNGGAFVAGASGTDYSQQDSNNTVGNNISTTDAVANGTTTITSATASFTSAIVGNIVYFTGGTGSIAAIRKQVTVFTNATTITIDSTIAASTGMTMNIGGALLTLAQAFTGHVNKNTFWLKSGTYTTTAATSSVAGLGLNLIGYGSSHGDNGTKPLLTTATNSVTLLQLGSTSNATNAGYYIHNVSFSNTAGTSATGLFNNNSGSGTYITISNCDFTGFTDAIGASGGVNGVNPGALIFTECSFTSNTSRAINTGAVLTLVRSCYIYGNGTGSSCTNLAQIYNTTGNPTVVCIDKSIVSGGANCGVHMKGSGAWSLQVTNSTIANNGGDGIRLANVTGVIDGPVAQVESTILYGNGGWGINADTTAPTGRTFIRNNGVGSNTSGNYTGVSSISGDVSLTASPFVSSTNFALNGTVGGGAALKALGFPGAFPGGTTTGYLDIGAVQTTGAPGTTGGVLVNPGMTGNIRG